MVRFYAASESAEQERDTHHRQKLVGGLVAQIYAALMDQHEPAWTSGFG